VLGQAWRDRWEYVIPFMAHEPEIRRMIYTTNAIEALNRQLRKALKTKGSFPSEDAAWKLIYLAVQNAVPQWTRTRGWTKALLALKIQFGDRLPDGPSTTAYTERRTPSVRVERGPEGGLEPACGNLAGPFRGGCGAGLEGLTGGGCAGSHRRALRAPSSFATYERERRRDGLACRPVNPTAS
jgi:hypothetical protein